MPKRSSFLNAWAVGIIAGLAVAAALIVIPRATLFDAAGRDACEANGQDFHGLVSPGRWDTVPEGARCTSASDPRPADVSVNFFASSDVLEAVLAWIYRLACVLLPIGVGLGVGFAFRRSRAYDQNSSQA